MARPQARKAFQRSALQTEATVEAAESRSLDLAAVSGINPLVAAANPLLSLVPQLRSSVSYGDLGALRDLLLRQMSGFEKSARERAVAHEHIQVAKYALCTLVDESIALTPWGGSGQWARTSLLVTLYKEVWGGEKFFLLLGKMAEDPAKNLNLLELMYVCLVLGFEGRYRVADNGRAQLEEVRERLYNMIRKQRGDAETALSVHWQGLQTTIGRTVRFLPLWVSAAVAALVLAGVFIALNISLNQRSDQLFSALAVLKAPAPPAPQVAVVPKPVPPRLSKFLTEEIKQGLVEVQEDETTSLVRIRGDGLFESGSATVDRAAEPLLGRIAEALNSVPGQVLVTGHTDSQPIRSARFPSNWHLSQDRAASVLRLMARTVKDPGRMKAEGRADAEPIAPNVTPADRARNRRVEVILKVSEQ
ncbi:MAG: DotU family type VI secretion system protein [Burkholderiales bacterium]|nr:DotU family type VI secretion system protein [Burkholderiales bacterium]